MTGGNGAGDEDEGRTIFVPAAGSGADAATDAAPTASGWAAASPDAPATIPPPAGSVPPVPATAAAGLDAPRRLQPGDVLNHIFEVRRYITAGGMGEVWEGVNTHTDERVAIKVMLPQLAADPNVQAMFRKEARTLTRLSHPALVAYRVLAIEPSLGILYIVTEYVDGTNLQDVLGKVPRDADSLRVFMRRLAEGLRAAHALGAIHRDMSPDNVLLEGGRLDCARIIDFGIAKDLDPHKGTIVGDGFAGKLGYVAPEQLGDFGREVGPWTDVYGLALVVLAVAGARAPAMGVTLVEAVDKRRAGADLSAAPEALRPILAAMLAADPARRLRSMDEVIEAIDHGVPAAPASAAPAAPAASPPVAAVAPSVPKPATAGSGRRGGGRGMWIGGGAVLAAMLAGGGWLIAGRAPDVASPPVTASGAAPAAPAAPGDPVAAAKAAIARALPGIACSWLDVRDLRREGDGVSFTLSGVAGDPVAAQGALQAALGAAAPIRTLNADVMTLPRNLCGAVETFAQVRAHGPALLSVEKQRWEMDRRVDSTQGDQKVARVAVYLDPRASGNDFTLVGWEDGSATATAMTRTQLLDVVFAATPDGRYMMKGGDITGTGVKGYALIRGRGPFPPDLVAPALPLAADWRTRFLAAARGKGWTVEMLWFQTQDLTPN
ncbi:serine/threonine-protein kinase [Sphingomonas adhaesiva]|uniref:serine/threonine-protein kinase n=1 Tax=Sphingomonas adhaesiva TaxID=28212 RepID=UPI0035C75CBA